MRLLVAELWASRDLLLVLARKEFYARYRRSLLGVMWAVIVPLVQATVLSIVFTQVINVSSAVHRIGGAGISYPLFIFTGVTAWAFFSGNMPLAATAIVDNSGLAGKIYFPRALFPLLVVATGVYPLIISIGVLVGITLLFNHSIGLAFFYVVPGSLLAIAITSGFGLCLSALHVYFRDVRFLVQAVISVMFYLSPILYSISAAHGFLVKVLTYGPMTGPIELFRRGTIGTTPHLAAATFGGLGWAVATIGLGLVLQSRYDRVFADLM